MEGGARSPGGHQGQLFSQGGEEGGEELQLLGRAPPGELEGDGGAQEDQSLAGGLWEDRAHRRTSRQEGWDIPDYVDGRVRVC